MVGSGSCVGVPIGFSVGFAEGFSVGLENDFSVGFTDEPGFVVSFVDGVVGLLFFSVGEVI